ncbi:MAG TPA: protoporphyrinogen oxidase, partial [Acidimicrobiales bacterium]
MTTVAVVGGGLTGLVAARAAAAGGRAGVVLVEAGDRLGGKLRTSTVAGLPVDEAPDAFLARVPEAVDLCRQLGLGDRLVSPARRSALVWSRGALRRLPDAQVLGVPTDLAALARSGIVSRAGVARAALDLAMPGRPVEGDEPVGALVRRRLGADVLERLVDPLIGGINAGDADRLSLAATAAPLAEAAARGGSLVRALARRPPPADPGAPVFATVRGGLGLLADALADDLAA